MKNQITDHDHGTTQELDKLTSENFASRVAQGNLASKNDIDSFVKKKDFDDKLKKVNKKVISNKTKHIEAEKKITDLTNKVVQISDKGYYFFARHFTGNDNSFSSHTDNGKNNFLVWVERLTQDVNDSIDAAERKFSINFSKVNKTFCLSFHYSGDENYLFANKT